MNVTIYNSLLTPSLADNFSIRINHCASACIGNGALHPNAIHAPNIALVFNGASLYKASPMFLSGSWPVCGNDY